MFVGQFTESCYWCSDKTSGYLWQVRQHGVTWVHKGTMKGTPPLPQHGPRVFWQQSPSLFNQPRSVRNWLCPSLGRCFHRAITHLPRLNVLAAVDSYAGYKATLRAVTVATPGSTASVFLNLLFRDQVQYLWLQKWFIIWLSEWPSTFPTNSKHWRKVECFFISQLRTLTKWLAVLLKHLPSQ